jgi:hypothetical protein
MWFTSSRRVARMTAAPQQLPGALALAAARRTAPLAAERASQQGELTWEGSAILV